MRSEPTARAPISREVLARAGGSALGAVSIKLFNGAACCGGSVGAAGDAGSDAFGAVAAGPGLSARVGSGGGSATAAAPDMPRLRQAAHSTSPLRRSQRVGDGGIG